MGKTFMIGLVASFGLVASYQAGRASVLEADRIVVCESGSFEPAGAGADPYLVGTWTLCNMDDANGKPVRVEVID